MRAQYCKYHRNMILFSFYLKKTQHKQRIKVDKHRNKTWLSTCCICKHLHIHRKYNPKMKHLIFPMETQQKTYISNNVIYPNSNHAVNSTGNYENIMTCCICCTLEVRNRAGLFFFATLKWNKTILIQHLWNTHFAMVKHYLFGFWKMTTTQLLGNLGPHVYIHILHVYIYICIYTYV